MAALRVFVSSTCVDLDAHRAQVRGLLTRMGYEPVMSDHSDVLYDHRLHTHTSCVKEVANADMVILIVGSRFGGSALPEALTEIDLEDVKKRSTNSDFLSDGGRLSITQLEVLKAIEAEIPLFVFVDSKVYSSHHLYQRNKDKPFAKEIVYPNIDKADTAIYIFEFINFISHRFSNNAVTPYNSFSEIEDHLLKQWSMLFQRLLRDERDKSAEARRADVMIEQIQDLKAAVLQSIGPGTGREIARSVLRFRRLTDFLLQLRIYRPDFEIESFTGKFSELLLEYGITTFEATTTVDGNFQRTVLLMDDDTHLRVRIPPKVFSRFSLDWKDFASLSRDTKSAVLQGVEASDTGAPPLIQHINAPFEPDEELSRGIERVFDVDLGLPVSTGSPPPAPWTEERIRVLKELWAQEYSASQIADTLGGVSRNAVIGKAHRLGLRSRPSPEPEKETASA